MLNKTITVAITGNPNSGKTTMYNALTGKSEHVGNWAGVTVDIRQHPIKPAFCDTARVIAVDLPGTYSMSAFTSDEGVASTYLKSQKPDVILNVVDSMNLSRSLFFTTQLLSLGIPVVVALNKADALKSKNKDISAERLSLKLGCPVIKTSSKDNEGLVELVKAVTASQGKIQKSPFIDEDADYSDKDKAAQADRRRFLFTNEIVKSVEIKLNDKKENTAAEKIDRIITNPVAGIFVFAFVIWFVFFISQGTLGAFLSTRLAELIDVFGEWAKVHTMWMPAVIHVLLIDGVISGVGAVLGFLPLVMIMYFMIALLEDCGYMARATFVLDPIFKKVGLSGKSVIPVVIGTGCAVPAVMACRTIRNECERRSTAMLCSFMPCGAKLPVIALFTSVFFPGVVWLGPAMYLVGICIILAGAFVINLVTGAKFRKSYFIIELPDYKVPSVKFAIASMFERGKSYIQKAGTVILVCNVVIKLMTSFTPQFVPAASDCADSMLAFLAKPLSHLLTPVVGFASWELAAAAVTGLIAKENIVATLATLSPAAVLSKPAALGYLMFNLFSAPCVAALGAMHSEMRSKKWFLTSLFYMLTTGFCTGFVVFQGGMLLTTGTTAKGFLPGILFIAVFLSVIFIFSMRAKKIYSADSTGSGEIYDIKGCSNCNGCRGKCKNH